MTVSNSDGLELDIASIDTDGFSKLRRAKTIFKLYNIDLDIKDCSNVLKHIRDQAFLIDDEDDANELFEIFRFFAPHPEKAATSAAIVSSKGVVTEGNPDAILYKGKYYPRFIEGKEFAGLYRGQPHYT